MALNKELPTFSFKQFSKGEISVLDLDSLDSPVDCVAEAVNVELNSPTGAISRTPGYNSSESVAPSGTSGYDLMFFIRFTINEPSFQESLVWYFKNQSGDDFRIWVKLDEQVTELTEKNLSLTSIGTITDDYIDFTSINFNAKYVNRIIYNVTKEQFAFIRSVEDNGSGFLRANTVEELLSNGYTWEDSDTYEIHRSLLTAFYSQSLSDITLIEFLELLSRLRVPTGVGSNAVAQWIGYLDNKIQAQLTDGTDRSIQLGEFHLEPLNGGINDAFDISFTGGEPSQLQIVVTAVDIEGQEVVVLKRTKNDAPLILEAGNGFNFNVIISPYLLFKRFVSYNVYANDDVDEEFYFLQSSTISNQIAVPIEDITQGNWLPSPLYQKISSLEPDDGTIIFSSGANPNYCEVKLGVLVDPLTGNGHSYKYRLGDFSVNGIGSFRVDLYEGATLRHTGATNPLPDGAIAEFLEELTPTEADAITDYANLRLRFYATDIDNDAQPVVSWAQFICLSLSTVIALNSDNKLQSTFSGSYSESGRLLYYNPELSVSSKFKSIRYLKGRVYIIDENEDIVRFTQFNTNGSETHDYFPFDKDSGFGYFSIQSGSSEKNTALAITREQNLVVFRGRTGYIYEIIPGKGFSSRLYSLFGNFGCLSQSCLDDSYAGAIIFANHIGIYYYSGGIEQPIDLLQGKQLKYYLSLPNEYKDNIMLKVNKQTNELWVYIQISGSVGSTTPSDYRFLVYSFTFNNWRKIQPGHKFTHIDNNRQDLIFESCRTIRVVKWDFGENKVLSHDGSDIPDAHILTHKLSNSLSNVEKMEEIYAEYDAGVDFNIEILLNDMTTPLTQNNKTFDKDLKQDFLGVRNGFQYNKFAFKVNLSTISLQQTVKEFGFTYYPLGGLHIGRTTK